MKRSTVLMWTVLAVLSAAALLAIVMILTEIPFGGKLLVSLLLTALFSLAALGCNFVLDRGVWVPAMQIGWMLCLPAWLVVLFFVWTDFRGHFVVGRVVLATSMILPLSLPVLGLLALTSFDHVWLRRLRAAALATVMLFGVLLYLHAVLDTDAHMKLTSVVAILTLLLIVVVPVAQRLYGLSRADQRLESARPCIVVRCPRCDFEQTLPAGRSACQACGLRIELRLEEPRCKTCNYLLYKLTSDRCPECGTPVPSAVKVGVAGVSRQPQASGSA